MIDIVDFKDYFVVKFKNHIKCISSTVINSGINKIRYVVFKNVEKDFKKDPVKYCTEFLKEIGIEYKETIIFLTAADVHKNRVIKYLDDMLIVITYGLKPIVGCNTINTFVYIDKNLNERALVEIMRIIGEIKALAFFKNSIVYNSSYATGTGTDAVAISSKLSGKVIEYAGLLTEIGRKISHEYFEILDIIIKKELKNDLELLVGINSKIIHDVLSIFNITSDKIGCIIDDNILEFISILKDLSMKISKNKYIKNIIIKRFIEKYKINDLYKNVLKGIKEDIPEYSREILAVLISLYLKKSGTSGLGGI